MLAGAYKDLDQFWDDTVEAFGRELKALADAGCRYLQIDETAFAKFGDPEVQAQLKNRGDDWSTLIDKYVAVTNRILKNAPAGMRGRDTLCRSRPPRGQPAVRLRQHRHRQSDHAGGAGAEASAGGGACPRHPGEA